METIALTQSAEADRELIFKVDSSIGFLVISPKRTRWNNMFRSSQFSLQSKNAHYLVLVINSKILDTMSCQIASHAHVMVHSTDRHT
jgi:hypothetical protein